MFVDGFLTEEFEVTKGVLQGDVLAQFLFVFSIDFLIKNSGDGHGFVTHPRRSRRDPAKISNDMDLAADITLLSSSKKDAQLQLRSHNEAVKEVGLPINIEKTEVMA